MDRPAAGGFVSLTGPSAPRVMVSPLRAMSMKSALRAYLTVSYGVISILLTGSLRSSPPYPAAPDFPRSSVGQSKGRPFYGQAKGLL